MYGESSSLDRQVIRGGSLCGHKIDTSGDIDTIDAGKEDWEFILVFGKWGGDSDSQEKKLDDSVTVVVIGGCESTLTGIRYSTDVTGECSGIYSDTMVREVGIELRRYFLWDAGRRKKTDWSEYKSADSILSGVDLRGVLSGVCNTCDDELYTSNHCHDSIYMAILRVSYSFRQLSGWGEGFRGHVIGRRMSLEFNSSGSTDSVCDSHRLESGAYYFGDWSHSFGVWAIQKKISRTMLADSLLPIQFWAEAVNTACYPASTPIEAHKSLGKDEEGEDIDVHLYRSMIGCLMYLTASRPDIMFVVCLCARFQVTPKVSHLHAVKRIFRYLKHQPNLGLWYPKDSPFHLEAFSDSDYAGDNHDRRSTSGGCQYLGRRLVSWQCKKQTIVAISSTEAEYVAAASCCAQVL
ncbi:hypothetical protein Tco_0792613 [Tanacetum coccineum]